MSAVDPTLAERLESMIDCLSRLSARDDAGAAEIKLFGKIVGDVREASSAIATLTAERDAYRKALEEIEKGEGRYSMDQLTHASNTIEDMKALARAARAEIRGGK